MMMRVMAMLLVVLFIVVMLGLGRIEHRAGVE
jgi:hypothetical protein